MGIMKIDGLGGPKELQTNKKTGGVRGGRDSKETRVSPHSDPPPDRVEISQVGQELMGTAKAALASEPDVRAERVKPLQAAVRDGTYHTDSAKIADAMIEYVQKHSQLFS